MIAEAGALDLSLVAKSNEQLSQVIWVAKLGSRHMDWNDVPGDVKGTLEVAVWHEVVEEKKDLAGLDVPSWEPNSPSPSLTTVWPSATGPGEFIEYQPEVGVPILYWFKADSMTELDLGHCWLDLFLTS